MNEAISNFFHDLSRIKDITDEMGHAPDIDIIGLMARLNSIKTAYDASDKMLVIPFERFLDIKDTLIDLLSMMEVDKLLPEIKKHATKLSFFQSDIKALFKEKAIDDVIFPDQGNNSSFFGTTPGSFVIYDMEKALKENKIVPNHITDVIIHEYYKNVNKYVVRFFEQENFSIKSVQLDVHSLDHPTLNDIVTKPLFAQLSSIKIANSSLRAESISCFLNAILQQESLSSLHLENISLHNMQQALVEFLHSYPLLEKLCLNNCDLDDEFIKNLTKINSMNKLKVLALPNNSFTNKYLNYFLRVQALRSLNQLELSYTGIQKAFVRKLLSEQVQCIACIKVEGGWNFDEINELKKDLELYKGNIYFGEIE